MEMKPNLNLNIEVHQARFDKLLNLPSLSCQFAISFNTLQISSRTISDPVPVWNESFNFEYKDSLIDLTFFHNPLFLKELILGKSSIPARDSSGWFDINNSYGKIGSVRLTVKIERFTSKTEEEHKLKLLQLQIVVDELKKAKEKYGNRLKKIAKNEAKLSRNDSKASVFDGSVSDWTLMTKIKYQLKVKEENLASQKEEIENSWRSIEREKKNLSCLQERIQNGCLDVRTVKDKFGKGEILTPLTCPRTPMSAKYSNLSELSLTQPRSAVGVESEHFLSTPKSKLINFE